MRFKPGAHQLQANACLVSWNCFGSCIGMCVCVCVCVSASETINQWHDMAWYWPVCDWLNKFYGFFYFFICFTWHLSLIKWIGMALVRQVHHEHLPRRLRKCGASYKSNTWWDQQDECCIYRSKWANAQWCI